MTVKPSKKRKPRASRRHKKDKQQSLRFDPPTISQNDDLDAYDQLREDILTNGFLRTERR